VIAEGESAQFTISGASHCGGDISIEAMNAPEWCHALRGSSDSNVTYSGTPTEPGEYTIVFVITDDENDMTDTVNVTVQVRGCDCQEPPICEFIAPNLLEIPAGGNSEIMFCYRSACPDSEVSIFRNSGPIDFCSDLGTSPGPDGGQCLTISCSPQPGDTGGLYTIEYIVTDLSSGETTTCLFNFTVIEPCHNSPSCTITPDGPITASVGEEFSFDVCGDSLCNGEISITPQNLPDWCNTSNMRFEQTCLTVTCTPPNNVEGMYTFEFLIEDSLSEESTTCSVDVEVACHLEPICYFTESGPYEARVGEPIDFEFCGVAACDGHRVRIEMPSRPPFIDPAGHQKGGVNETLCLPIKGTPGPGDVGKWQLHITATDLGSGVESECSILIRVLEGDGCLEPPVCQITQGDQIEVGLNESFPIEICASSACGDGAVTIEVAEPSALCDSFGLTEGEPGEELCTTLPCSTNDVNEPGEYLVRFLITDTSNGQTSICETMVIVGGGSAGCVEEEPNNEIGLCTMLDARQCLDIGCGSLVSGYLDDSGSDVDVYCIGGLSPGAIYGVRVLRGVNRDLEFTCAVAVCLDASGVPVENGSNRSTIECLTDDSGTLFLGVSGCGDLDLDGQIDSVQARGNPIHDAIGSYQILITPSEVIDEASITCHADMNGDGMVDSADMGMLIDVFGESCAP